jgi:hypothetical protein
MILTVLDSDGKKLIVIQAAEIIALRERDIGCIIVTRDWEFRSSTSIEEVLEKLRELFVDKWSLEKTTED